MNGWLGDPRLHLILLAALIVVGWISWRGEDQDDVISRSVVVVPAYAALH